MEQPVRFKGCGRGVFGLSSWEPLQKVGTNNGSHNFSQIQEIKNENSTQKNNLELSKTQNISDIETKKPENTLTNILTDSSKTVPDTELPEQGDKLLVKYNYRAKINSPLGEGAEISVNQKDEVYFEGVHPTQTLWWKVKDSNDSTGFIPANYVMKMETKFTGLPWLQKKENSAPDNIDAKINQPWNTAFEKCDLKPYKSSYDKPTPGVGKAKEETDLSEYFCAVCQKQLNGPVPYKMHMNSKSHKEEVELAEEYAHLDS